MSKGVVDTTTRTATEYSNAFNPLDAFFAQDPGPLLAGARRDCPVFFSPAVNAWVVTRYSDVDSVLMNPVRYSSKDILSINDLISPEVTDYFGDAIPMEGTLIGVDPPEHTRLRKVLAKALSHQRVRELEPAIDFLVSERIQLLKSMGYGDLVRELCYPLPLTVISRLIGIPERETALFRRVTEDWSELSVAYLMGVPLENQMALAERIMALHGRVLEMFAERRINPRDDLLTAIVQQQSEIDLSEHEMLSLVPGLFLAGHETTANVLATGLYHLLSVPSRWAALVTHPESIPAVVEELLRLDGPVFGMWRNVTRDSVIAGVNIPKGSRLYLSFWSANLDEQRFEGAGDYASERHEGLNLAFGRGVHFCIGAPLARMELRTALAVLARELPGLRLADGFTPSYAPHFFLRGISSLPVSW